MKIHNLQIETGSNIFYNQKFRVVLEDHMTYLRTHEKTRVIDIEPVYAYKYSGDLSSLLTHYGYPVEMHWIIMRANNFNSFHEKTDDVRTLVIPSSDIVERIRQGYLTKNKLST